MEEADKEIYRRQNFGNTIGFGAKAALLIIDFINGFHDPAMFGGGNIPEAIEKTVPLLTYCRQLRVPIAYTRVVYAKDGSDAGVFAQKLPGLLALTDDSHASQIVEPLTPLPGEYIIRKTQPSAFFGTELSSWLIRRGIDTLFIAGCTTSGCVRSTVVDAMMMNFRPMVVEECVGDRALGPHQANLFDMHQKYADIISLNDAMAGLESHF